MITGQNADKAHDLVSPGTLYKVNQGMSMKIVSTGRLDSPPFKQATVLRPGVALSHDHSSLLGYVAGQPFPLIDANDPYVARKVARNNQFCPLLGDDYDLRYFDCEKVYGGRNKT